MLNLSVEKRQDRMEKRQDKMEARQDKMEEKQDFPLIVITSFNFNNLEAFVSFFPFTKTRSWSMIC